MTVGGPGGRDGTGVQGGEGQPHAEFAESSSSPDAGRGAVVDGREQPAEQLEVGATKGVEGTLAAVDGGQSFREFLSNVVREGGDAESKRLAKVVTASALGNILEWFDFGVFAYFASEIGASFFPPSDAASSLMQAFAVFGGAFFIRPLGGVLFGILGDTYGRKTALTVSVIMMGASTFLMGCLPTYRDVGVWAPLLLVTMRMVQGLSVGGEMVGSIIFSVESSPANRQVFVGGLAMSGAIGGLTLGSFAGLLIHTALPEESVLEWGWRIPFFSGVIIAVFALWMRKNVSESVEFEESMVQRKREAEARGTSEGVEMCGIGSDESKLAVPGSETREGHSSGGADGGQMPLMRALKEHPLEILVMFLVVGAHGFGVWIMTAFPPSLYQDLMDPPLGYPRQGGGRREGGAHFERSTTYIWVMHTALCFLQVFAIGTAAWLGDYVGNTRMMIVGCALIVVGAVPCLAAMGQGSIGAAVLGQGSMMCLISVLAGNLPTWLVLCVPVEIRFTTIAIGYNAGQAAFGGTASLLATLIYSKSRSTALIGLYHASLAFLALMCVVWSARRRRREDDPLAWMAEGVRAVSWVGTGPSEPGGGAGGAVVRIE